MAELNELFRARARSKLGTTVRGKYRLDAVLGIGGMATVFGATHRNSKEFALKMLHPELSDRPEVRARFLREGYVANTVGHDGAVSVLDDDVGEDGGAFLVMERLRGRSLDVLWDRAGRALPGPAVIAVTDQLLAVLAAAHEKGIVHRDIKPANLFLTTTRQLRVLDFGVARLRDAASRVTTTDTGSALGTPAFMAPESALGKTSLVDQRSNLWAVGATMFTLLSGSLVHEAETAQELLVFAATRPARSLASARADAPKAVVELVNRALAHEREDRWPSAGAMREALVRASVAAFGEEPSPERLAPLLRYAEPAPCLSEDTLAALVEGRLAPRERFAMDEHLDLCPECRTLVHALRPENHRSSETSRRDESNVASGAISPSETTRPGSSSEPSSSIDRALASALLSPVEALGVATTVLRNPDSVATATVRPLPSEATARHGFARPRTRVWVGAGVLAVLASIGAIAALTHRPAALDPAPSSPASSLSIVASPAPPPPHAYQPMPAASAEPSAAPPSASVVRAAPSQEPRAPAGARRLPVEGSPAPAPSRPAKAGPWDHL